MKRGGEMGKKKRALGFGPAESAALLATDKKKKGGKEKTCQISLHKLGEEKKEKRT